METQQIREMRARVLELQARSERALAEKQTDPALRNMILNSAVGKEEAAYEVRTRQRVTEPNYQTAVSHSLHTARLTTKR